MSLRTRVGQRGRYLKLFWSTSGENKDKIPGGPIFASIVMSTSGHTFARRTHDARHDTSHHFDFDASWFLSSMAAQSILGVWSFRRTGDRFDYCCDLGTDGTYLDCHRDVKRII